MPALHLYLFLLAIHQQNVFVQVPRIRLPLFSDCEGGSISGGSTCDSRVACLFCTSTAENRQKISFSEHNNISGTRAIIAVCQSQAEPHQASNIYILT